MNPVERWAGVDLPSGRDVRVTGDIGDRVARGQRARKFRQPSVLRVSEGRRTGAFQLDADGKIVAARPALPARVARMPRAPGAGNELDQFTVTADEEVSGYPGARNSGVERVRLRVEAVGEEFDDARPAEFSRRQADVVDDEEFYRATGRAFVAVGRRYIANAFDDPSLRDARSYRQSDKPCFLETLAS